MKFFKDEVRILSGATKFFKGVLMEDNFKWYKTTTFIYGKNDFEIREYQDGDIAGEYEDYDCYIDRFVDEEMRQSYIKKIRARINQEKKGKKQTSESKLLELSMNTQCILSNTADKQQIRDIIDSQDDLRREEFRDGLNEKMLSLYESLENNDLYKAKKEFMKLESYFKNEFKKEDYFERLDDENRLNTKHYLNEKTENIKNINALIEKELISRNK